MFLEDDSGRIRLVGGTLKSTTLVTGCIVAVLGTENSNGELEVIDIKFPDLAPQPERWAASNQAKDKSKSTDEDQEMQDSPSSSSKKIAIVSGLAFSDTDASHTLELNLLLEYLLGEALGPSAQNEGANITRLIIAGNSISTSERKDENDATAEKKVNKKYGYDASSYNPLPSQLFDDFLTEILPTMPVTLLPGAQDPANASYPQQPIHTAMFPGARVYSADPKTSEPGWLDTVTNPWEAEIEGWRVLGTGGQNVDDVFKYVDSDDRLGMMEAMCRWRCCAPTAPDTLCKFHPHPNWICKSICCLFLTIILGSYPFQDEDPFVMKSSPHLYFVGNQPEFSTKVIQGLDDESIRLVMVPSFADTKELVLVDVETLEVSRIHISVE